MIALLAALAHAGCAERPLVPAPPGSAEATAPCMGAALRLAGRLYASTPPTGIHRGLAFPAPRAEVRSAAPGDVSARLAVVPVQSGGPSSYIGVDGESWVPALQIAESRWDFKPAGLAVAAGLVDDPWTIHELRVTGLRVFAPGAAQDEGWMARSDLGAWVAWTVPDRWVTVSLTAQSGEGANRRERNNGVNTALQVVARPVGGTDRVELMLFVRDGSRGLSSARDHRAGVFATGDAGVARFGIQGLLGWGAGADATLTPTVWSVHARSGALPFLAYARLDRAQPDRANPRTATHKVFAGAGPRLPWTGDRPRPTHLVVGTEARLPGPDAGPTAGQPTPQITGFVQLSTDIDGQWSLGGAP